MEDHQILAKTLSALGIPDLNALQKTTAPAILQHSNLILLAPTGSGKTLAFLIPILHLLQIKNPSVQCLILSPTRELAIQIERVWQKMSTGFKVSTCYGGHSFQTETQNLTEPPALLIGTPGRILEHIQRNTFALNGIRFLVLDEFDKSLSMGFQEQMTDIIKVLAHIEKRILVSATPKLNIPEFTGVTHPKVLNFYKESEKSTDGLIVKRIIAQDEDKNLMLFQLLCFLGNEQTLIFCNQRDTTEMCRDFLIEKGISCACFHGGMEQADREKTLVQFRNGSIVFLVASDLASRGLDIPEVKNVIHYDLPMKHADFLHRNGRTARMHAEGTAYLLITQSESLPVYLPDAPILLELNSNLPLPKPSPWITLYISGGKKDKLRKLDIVGFLSQKAHLQKEDIGIIEVMDFMSFVAIKKERVRQLFQDIKHEKMKGKKYKIVVTN